MQQVTRAERNLFDRLKRRLKAQGLELHAARPGSLSFAIHGGRFWIFCPSRHAVVDIASDIQSLFHDWTHV